MDFFLAGYKYDGLFRVAAPGIALLRSHCQAYRRFRSKASRSCIAVDANILGPVRGNTALLSAGHLALNENRSELLLQPHGSYVFDS